VLSELTPELENWPDVETMTELALTVRAPKSESANNEDRILVIAADDIAFL
jgi:hypothetical protein